MDRVVHVAHLIDGAWLGGGPAREIRNPARPDEVVALAPTGGAAEAEAALAAARRALPAWSRLSAIARGEILFRASILLAERAEAIGAELTREEGKTLAEGIGETRRAAAILRYAAGRTAEPIGSVFASATPGTRIGTIRQPIGVVAVVSPWNFPIAIPAWKIAPALAYGNTVVFKPASATPLLAYRLAEILTEAGLPPGVLALVHASGADVEQAWLGPGGVDALSFTGSEFVGRRLQAVAGAAHAKVQVELGGKNAVLVAPDADIERAADMVARGAFASAGQKCTATSRVITIGSASESLRAALIERVARLLPGDPLEPSTTLGPVIDRAAVERIGAAVDTAAAAGARVVAARDVPSTGWFSRPTLLDGVSPEARIAREEVFGPVVALIEARDIEEAIDFVDIGDYGLAASIFTRDLATADAFVQAVRAGIVHVNGETAGAEPHVPFGGMKGSSSWSREQGPSAEEFYTQIKTVYWDGLSVAGPFDADERARRRAEARAGDAT